MPIKKVGLVGFGSIAEHSHLPAWQSLPGVEVVAVADLSSARLDQARSLVPGATLYDSPMELIERGNVDLVDICAPPAAHARLLVAACGRGLKNIVCEKPFVLTEDEYTRVAWARTASGSRIVSVNNWVHSDLNRHVLATLRAGTIGAVQSVDLHIGRPDCALGSAGWNPRWRTDVAHSGGGIIQDHGWHQFYLLMGWVGSPVEGITATTRTVNPEHYPVEDEAAIGLYFTGATGSIRLSWTANGRTNYGTIRGERGTIQTYDDRVVIQNGGPPRELLFTGAVSRSSYHPEWFSAVFEHNVLNENRHQADRNFQEAGTLVSVIQAAYRSAHRGGERCRPLPAWGAHAPSEETVMTNGSSGGGPSA
ncbi:MAG: Gfo/Idh/MocA family oxidoreductase [Chloroflexota bacterium]